MFGSYVKYKTFETCMHHSPLEMLLFSVYQLKLKPKPKHKSKSQLI